MTFAAAVKYRKAGKYIDALKEVERLERSNPPLTPAKLRKLRFFKADVLLDMEKFRDAISCYDEILADEPSDVAYGNKALAHWELKQYKPALKAYLAAIKFNPANEIAQRGAGEMHIKLGSPDAALPFLKKSLLLNPKYQAAHTSMGIALYQLGKWAEAYVMLREALELDADDWEAKKGIKLIEKHLDQ